MKHVFHLLVFVALSSSVLAAQPEQTFALKPGASFEWMLSKATNKIPNADVIDLDLFDTSAKRISTLNKAGKKTICYISVGSWENWRPDKKDFPAASLGKDYDGWPGEKWLDIAHRSKFEAAMKARLDMCKAKGFWGVEPDNINLHEQDSGFKITRQQQIDYSIWLAQQAHLRGLSIGIKNVPDLLPVLQEHYDWALLEDCYENKFCADFKPMVKAGKAVFAVEYTDANIDFRAFCRDAKAFGFFPLLKKRELGIWTKQCP